MTLFFLNIIIIILSLIILGFCFFHDNYGTPLNYYLGPVLFFSFVCFIFSFYFIIYHSINAFINYF